MISLQTSKKRENMNPLPNIQRNILSKYRTRSVKDGLEINLKYIIKPSITAFLNLWITTHFWITKNFE